MLERLKRNRVLLLLVAAALAVGFVGGAVALFGFQNIDRIKKRFFPPKMEQFDDTIVSAWSTIETGLLTLKRADIQLGDTVGYTSGGAIDSVGNTILYVSATGHIATVDLDSGKIEYSPVRVPIEFEELYANVFGDKVQFNSDWFRVQDILIKREKDPGTATLYVSHHKYVPEHQQICAVINRTKLDISGGKIKLVDGKWEEVYRLRECLSMEEFDWGFLGLESGGKMLLLDDNHILMGVGDYGLEWEIHLHDRVGMQYDNDFSKIMNIDLTTGESSVYANGVRTSQGLTRGSDGGIWEAEHGPQGGDEINYVLPGKDFGWPTVSLGMNYGSPRVPIPTNPVQGRHDGFDKPVMAFMPSIGISALAAVSADPPNLDLWAGDLLAVSLRDESLFHLRRDGQHLLYAEEIPLGSRLRDVIVLENGWIAILTGGERSLILLRSMPDQGDVTPLPPITISGYDKVDQLQDSIHAIIGMPDPQRAVFRQHCASCHSTNGEVRVAPPLNGLFKRKIGSVPGYTYSHDLADAHGKWTKSRLKRFLRDPQAMYPGTGMPPPGELQDWEERAIMDYLSRMNDQ